MTIDRAAADGVMGASLTSRLSLDAARIAWGIHEVINEDVARAFRIHASERGVDYRRCSMIAFGGSGPIHALRIARKLKIPQVICPSGAGVMSAFGLLISPLSFEVVRSRRIALENLGGRELETLFGDLEDAAARPLLDAGVKRAEIRIARRLDMRYQGQGYEVEVALPDAQVTDSLCGALPTLFAEAYRRVFAVSYADKPLEIVNWKVEARAAAPGALPTIVAPNGAAGPRRKGTRPAFFPEADGFTEVPVFDRYALAAGDVLDGPALVEERESTCVIGVGDRVQVDKCHNLIATWGDTA
jgi:N-methylhydantoinase A